MPTVPKYQRQVRQASLPGPRLRANATPDDFGAREARDIGKIGNALGRAAMDIEQKERRATLENNKAIARDKLNSARTDLREYMAANVYSQKGKEATEVYGGAKAKLDEFKRNYAGQLDNDEQREFFGPSYDSLTQSHLDKTLAFQEQKKVEFTKNTLEAENFNALEDAVESINTPLEADGIREAEFTIVNNTRKLLEGQDSRVKKRKVEEGIHNLHHKIVAAKAATSPKTAQEYMNNKNVWSKLNPLSRVKLKMDIDKMTEDQWVYEKTLEISGTRLPLEEQLRQVDKIPDVEKSDKVRRRVKVRFQEDEAAKELKAKKAYEQEVDVVFSMANQGANYLDSYKVPLRFPADKQKDLQGLRDKFMREALGKGKSTNWESYQELVTMDPEKFKEVNIARDYQGKLAGSEIKELIKMQKKGGVPPKLRSPYQQATQALSGMQEFLVRADKGKLGDDDKLAARRKASFFSEFQKKLTDIPEDERTEEKIQDLIYGDMLAPAVDTWGIPGLVHLTDDIYRFEIGSQKDEAIKDRLAKANIPDKLKKFNNVEYDEGENKYFVLGAGVKDIYDIYGNFITRYKKPLSPKK